MSIYNIVIQGKRRFWCVFNSKTYNFFVCMLTDDKQKYKSICLVDLRRTANFKKGVRQNIFRLRIYIYI